MKELAVQFGSAGSLIGVLTEPAAERLSSGLPDAIFLNSGLLHRTGSNRMSVTLSRRIAEHGFRVLRFDLSGIGDSRAVSAVGDPNASLPTRFQDRWIAETRQAMDWLGSRNGSDRFVLFGHCSGAAVAYLAAQLDPRVTGLCLLNPPVPFRLRQFLRTTLLHPNGWRRMFSGRLKIGGRLQKLARRPARLPGASPDIPAGLRRLAERGVDVLIARSEWDRSHYYFERVLHAELAPLLGNGLRSEAIPGADHDLTLRAHQARFLEIADQWTAQLCRS